MAFEELSIANEELERMRDSAELAEPTTVDIHRFRALGRTQMIGRNPNGTIISKEGLEIQQAMKHNETAHRQAKREE